MTGSPKPHVVVERAEILGVSFGAPQVLRAWTAGSHARAEALGRVRCASLHPGSQSPGSAASLHGLLLPAARAPHLHRRPLVQQSTLRSRMGAGILSGTRLEGPPVATNRDCRGASQVAHSATSSISRCFACEHVPHLSDIASFEKASPWRERIWFDWPAIKLARCASHLRQGAWPSQSDRTLSSCAEAGNCLVDVKYKA